MSRTDLRALLLVAAAAFALRAGAAVLTELKSIFPAYYYTDAVLVDRYARETVQAWSRGNKLLLSYSPPQRTHILLTALLYRTVGPHPIAAKLVNALAATLGIAAFGLLTGRLFGPAVGLASAALIAAWPSHAFNTSQNFKEGLICGALLGAFLLMTPGEEAPRRRDHAAVAGGILLLGLMGFFRSHVMIVAAASLAAAAAWALFQGRGSRKAAAIVLAACLATPVLSQLTFRALLEGPLKAAIPGASSENVLIPRLADTTSGEVYRPLSPRGITKFRHWRQFFDRNYAQIQFGREISTQLFPDENMETWLDVARFIPKASFYVLFMPLPGLYPMDGKPGRMLAAAENLVLLALFVLALAGAARGGLEPRRMGFLLFFSAMAAGSSLIEFDLGSAGRHKLMYLPMLFPFAAEEAARLMRRGRKA